MAAEHLRVDGDSLAKVFIKGNGGSGRDSPATGKSFCRVDSDSDPPPCVEGPRRVSLFPLIALIYYEVSGGPFGLEDAVGAAGSMFTVLALLTFPIFWCLPQAVVTAELISMFPEDSGFVAWVTAAFGRFLGFLEGFLLWCSCVADSALYPVLCLEYFTHLFPFYDEPLNRLAATYVLIILLTWLSYRGLNTVGVTSVWLALFCITPFIAIVLLGLPRMRRDVWNWKAPTIDQVEDVDWRTFLNVLFWSLNSWDSASTLAGEVENPTHTFPRALKWTLCLVTAVYTIPILVATGVCIPDGSSNGCQPHESWKDGYFATVALTLGGKPLQALLVLAAALSNIGLFFADLSASSFLILGMAESGFLPSALARRSRYGTPVYGILLSAAPVFIIALHPFTVIMGALNCLYCMAVPFQFAAFLWLRWKRPNAPRPFKAPLPMWLLMLLVVSANVIMLSVLLQASATMLLLSYAVCLLGVALYCLLWFANRNKWCSFHLHDEGGTWLPPMASVAISASSNKKPRS